jgi:hypothetical protein
MAPVQDVVAHSIELKQELVSFLRDRRVAREYEDALDEEFGDDEPDDDDLIDFRDEFLLQFRMSDDRTPVERFVRSRGDLPRDDRDLLLSWVDPWDSIFEVVDAEDGTLHVTSVVEEAPYRVRSAEVALGGFEPGTLVGMRLVPAGEDWLLVGSVLTVPDDAVLLQSAAAEAILHDEVDCPNDAHREQARELQRHEREVFVEHFGADFLVVPGPELPSRLASFWTALGRQWDAELEDWPGEVLETPRVGLGYDVVDGLIIDDVYDGLAMAFESEVQTPETLELVRLYAEDPDEPPAALLSCVAEYPDRADAVLAAALERPGFRWSKDGDALLHEFKAAYLDGEPRPAVSVVAERLQPYVEKADVARLLKAWA